MRPSSVVWIDEVQAALVHLSEERMERRHLLHPLPGVKIDSSLFEQVARELLHSAAIVLVGPQFARERFKDFLARLYPRTALAVIDSIESPHPSDLELAHLATRYFMTRPA
jgi:stalled ribosome rescue protein Dom34